jgi:hypothetical protein
MTYSIKNCRYLVEKEELEGDFYFALCKKGTKEKFLFVGQGFSPASFFFSPFIKGRLRGIYLQLSYL